jgi:hypothetical protein
MSDVVTAQEVSRGRRRRDDLWIGMTALVAAMLALPMPMSMWHGPEVAATLAIGATAMLAGQRWAIAVVVLAELLLVPTIWPRAAFGDDLLLRVASLGALLAVVPGVLASRRAAAALVLLSGWRRTRTATRRIYVVLVALGIVTTMLPIL